MIDKDVAGFFNDMSEEDREKIKKATDVTSSEGNRSKIDVPGKYRVAVRANAWDDKESGVMNMLPRLSVSKKKKSLMLQMSLEVVDGTELVSVGSTIFHNIVLVPSKGADNDKISGTLRLMKPQLVALTGNEDIDVSNLDWVAKHLIAEFKKGDKGYVVSKDHEMKNEVMITVDETIYEGKTRCQVINLSKAGPAEVSESVQVKHSADTRAATEDVVAESAITEDAAATPVTESSVADAMADDVLDTTAMTDGETPDC